MVLLINFFLYLPLLHQTLLEFLRFPHHQRIDLRPLLIKVLINDFLRVSLPQELESTLLLMDFISVNKMIKLNLILLIDGIYLLQDNFDLLVRDIDLGELGLRLVENIPYN